MEKHGKPTLKEPEPITKASPEDVARGLFNPDVGWGKVQAKLEDDYDQYGADMRQYRTDMTEFERKSQ